MKTQKLIQLLSPGERNEFRLQLSVKKNKKTSRIFDFLLREKKEADTLLPRLYKSVFGKTRTDENDFLLRNELRLLNRELELFLAIQKLKGSGADSDAEATLLFLQTLLDREAWTLFEKEWEKEFRRFDSLGDWKTLVRLGEVNLEYVVRRRKISAAGLSHVLEVLNQFDELTQRAQAHRQAELRLYRAQLARQQSESDPTVPLAEIPAPVINTDPSADPFLGYAEQARHAYLSRGEKTIGYMEKALEFLERCKPRELHVVRMRTQIRTQIALEYFLLGEYKRADQYYKTVLPDAHSLNDNTRIASVYLNYISNLIRLREFSAVLLFISEHEKIFASHSGFRQRIACLGAMCCIYTGKIREAKSLVMSEIGEAKQDTLIYLRLTLGIVLYLQGKRDLAVREMNNLQQSLRHLEIRHEQYAQAARLFSRAIELENNPGNKRTRSLLRKEFAEFDEQTHKQFEILPVKWINEEVGKKI